MDETQQPTVGRIVHVIKAGECHAAIVVGVDDEGTEVQRFPRGREAFNAKALPFPGYEAYNSLRSARPTSGWHWPQEHNETS